MSIARIKEMKRIIKYVSVKLSLYPKNNFWACVEESGFKLHNPQVYWGLGTLGAV